MCFIGKIRNYKLEEKDLIDDKIVNYINMRSIVLLVLGIDGNLLVKK